MKLKLDTRELGELPMVSARPTGTWLAVPTGFLTALLQAARFTGPHNATYPWIKYVYLLEGKLYASDNHCIVEFDLGERSFANAHFIREEVKVLRARGARRLPFS